jgi:hypothetical protein
MTNYAFNSVKESYDIDTLREIVEHGCVSGVAYDHIYYAETCQFFEDNEEEIIEYITNTIGDEFIEEVWNNNPGNITGYKNDITWTYVELVASQLVDEYEDTTCEELSDESYEILTSNKEVRELVTS